MIPAVIQESPKKVAGDLEAAVEAYLVNSLARGQSRATVAYRRVYLGQLLVWLTARFIIGAHAVTTRERADARN